MSSLGVWAYRDWSRKRGIIDFPNARSSHETPTPRGGGLVVVVVCLVFYGGICCFYPAAFSWGYLAGAALIAVISWLDDVYTVSSLWRFLIHGLAAILIIADRGSFSEISLPGLSGPIGLGSVGPVLTFLWIVWLVNAYNFMDGIDGIAGTQAVVAGAAWTAVGWLTADPVLMIFAGVVTTASLGFLIHNWQPARIFMGDVGSAFFGFTFAALPLMAGVRGAKLSAYMPLAAVVFVWFFVFDSLLTLARRAIRGERVWNAHKEHLYQRLVSAGFTHSSVSALYGVMTMIVSVIVLLAITYPGRFDQAVLPVIFVVTMVFLIFCAKKRALV